MTLTGEGSMSETTVIYLLVGYILGMLTMLFFFTPRKS
jgi:hypothetical protein